MTPEEIAAQEEARLAAAETPTPALPDESAPSKALLDPSREAAATAGALGEPEPATRLDGSPLSAPGSDMQIALVVTDAVISIPFYAGNLHDRRKFVYLFFLHSTLGPI